jgi:hypothetical protein
VLILEKKVGKLMVKYSNYLCTSYFPKYPCYTPVISICTQNYLWWITRKGFWTNKLAELTGNRRKSSRSISESTQA